METDPGHRVTRHHGGQRKGEVRHDEDGGEERTAAGRRGEPDKASHHAKPGDSESDAGRRGAAKEQERRFERNPGDGEGQPGGQGHSPEPHRPGCLPRTNRDHADGANTGEKCDRQPAESSIVRRGELQGQARTQRKIEPGDAPARNQAGQGREEGRSRRRLDTYARQQSKLSTFRCGLGNQNDRHDRDGEAGKHQPVDEVKRIRGVLHDRGRRQRAECETEDRRGAVHGRGKGRAFRRLEVDERRCECARHNAGADALGDSRGK